MDKVKEITAETLNVLSLTAELKKDIKNAMMHGEESIIRGIIFFEGRLKNINPNKIDDEEIDIIENDVRNNLSNREETFQKVNPSMHYGVNRCFLILETNYRMKKELEKKKKTRKI